LLTGIFPLSTIRVVWRQLRLSAWSPIGDTSAYNRDRIKASQEKDIVLRYQWLGIITSVGYAVMNLVNRVVKFTLGICLYLMIHAAGVLSSQGLSSDWAKATTSRMRKWLDEHIVLQDALSTLPGIRAVFDYFRRRTVAAAHVASDYADVFGAGSGVMQALRDNESVVWQKRYACNHEQVEARVVTDEALAAVHQMTYGESTELTEEHQCEIALNMAVSYLKGCYRADDVIGIKSEDGQQVKRIYAAFLFIQSKLSDHPRLVFNQEYDLDKAQLEGYFSRFSLFAENVNTIHKNTPKGQNDAPDSSSKSFR
jgi:hypothetical protein